MKRNEIPKRSERWKIIKRGVKNLDEYIMLRELEKIVKDRLTEKLLITTVALIWLLIGLFGKTVHCALWGIPLSIITLIVGVWLL